MVTDYIILKYVNSQNMSESVNNFIKQGWQPQGNLTHNGEEFYQVMVKDDYHTMQMTPPVIIKGTLDNA